MPMKVQVPVNTSDSDESLSFIRQMGIEHACLYLRPEEINDETLEYAKERLHTFYLTVTDVICPPMQKNKIIQLGLDGRDAEIEQFNQMLRVLGNGGIPFTSVAWQPNGILRTGMKSGQYTRSGISMYADMTEINARPAANGRAFSEREIWDGFMYFLDRILPVAEETGVRIALHPSDPPVESMAGVPSLIYNTETFRKVFDMAGGSRALGMKLCTGCWLEAGDAFGDLMEDIRAFCAEDRVLCVHFRNVSAPMPYFEETLAEDGYANMYAIMKQLVACDCNAVISIDHAFKGSDSTGGELGASAYPTGYLKGLMHAAEIELGKRRYD